MIIKTFPEKNLVESGKAEVVKNWGLKNIIMSAQASNVEYNNITGPLSIKYAFSGVEWYCIDGHELLVNQANFLLLNAQHTYSTFIRSDTQVDSFVLFFKDGIFSEISTYNRRSKTQLLDDPDQSIKRDFQFIEKRYSIDLEFQLLLKKLKNKIVVGVDDALELDSHIYLIVEKLLSLHERTELEIDTLDFKKTSTKTELYKRLYRTKDFIDSSFNRPIDLEQLSQISCLSKYHFLRVFKSVFKKTPHQYIQQKRLEKAYQLLLNGYTVQEACWNVGFLNVSSFSRLFIKSFGITPSSLK